jgi:UDP-GlcNAc:undecaprenyl-phosphate GlcNAc-1-phosphate transferase
MLVAGAGAAALGSYDDLAGSGSSRGFRGHLGALRRGELTTGAVKIAGIGATGLVASALLGSAGSRAPGGGGSGRGRTRGGGSGGGVLAAADIVINAGLVAGGANLLNLFDLRPGRAVKVALGAGGVLAAVPGQGRPAVAAPLAAAAALLPEDLGERAMLGDGGANALGAMLGTAAAVGLPRSARVLTLAGIVGLTAASEVVSFTKVIERTAPLRWLDMLGRRPVAPSAGPAQDSGEAVGEVADSEKVADSENVAGTGTEAAAGTAGDPADSAAAGISAPR